MSVYFLDSSALVKRYVEENGSVWIRTLTDPRSRHKLIIARVTWVEILSAFARRQREGTFAPADAAKALQSFRFDLDNQYQVVEVDRSLIESAGQLVASIRCGPMTLSNWHRSCAFCPHLRRRRQFH